MKYEVFEGKTEVEAKEKALTELNISENECLTRVEKIHTGLLKKESVKLYVYKLTDIVDYLKEYLESKIISDYVENKYQELSEILSVKDADLRAIGKEAQNNGKNTLVVSDNVFKFLENYGFNIISLDEDTLTEGLLNSVKNNFKKGTYSTIFVLDNNYTDNINSIVNDYKAKTIDVKSMTNIETNNTDDYLTVMQEFIDNIENICIS